MTCATCSSQPLVHNYCARCFCTWFERKARRELRDLDFKKGTLITIANTHDTNSVVVHYLLTRTIYLPLVFDPQGKTIVPSSLESEARELLATFFENKKKDHSKQERYPFLVGFEQKDIDLYAQLKKLTAPSRDYTDDLSHFIAQLNERFRNCTTSLAKVGGVLKDL